MPKIEEFLKTDERVIKEQARITAGNMAGMPSGNLYLTNRRLIFIHSKGWSILSPAPGAALMGKNIMIPLQDIKSVRKGFGSVKVRADKEYQFMVSVWKAGGWVEAIQQAMKSSQQMPVRAETPSLRPRSGSKVERFCTGCGTPAKPGDKFCGSCGTRLE